VETVETMLLFAFMGFLGGLARALIVAKKWSDVRKFKTLRRVVIGVISGFVYFQLWSQYTFPNTIMAFVVGWWGVSFLERLAKRLK